MHLFVFKMYYLDNMANKLPFYLSYRKRASKSYIPNLIKGRNEEEVSL